VPKDTTRVAFAKLSAGNGGASGALRRQELKFEWDRAMHLNIGVHFLFAKRK